MKMIKQTGSIDAYIEAFETLVYEVHGISDMDKVYYFIAGLKPKCRAAVGPQQPASLELACQLARKIEAFVSGGMPGVKDPDGRHFAI